jgi:hypothetical protein
LWIEQAHAQQPPVTMNALDHVSAHLKLKDNSCREGHAGGVQFRERDRLISALSQPIQHPLLLDIKDIHRSNCRAAAWRVVEVVTS